MMDPSLLTFDGTNTALTVGKDSSVAAINCILTPKYQKGVHACFSLRNLLTLPHVGALQNLLFQSALRSVSVELSQQARCS